MSNDFQENKEPTIGGNSFAEIQIMLIPAAFLTQKCRLENRMIKFEIWDTAGQERFHSLAPMYYRYALQSQDVDQIEMLKQQWWFTILPNLLH